MKTLRMIEMTVVVAIEFQENQNFDGQKFKCEFPRHLGGESHFSQILSEVLG